MGLLDVYDPAEIGKFLIFEDASEIDEVWEKIKGATEDGRLGGSSKVSTTYPNEYDVSRWVICVYCHVSRDEEEKQRIREELRELGIKGPLRYKTDEETSHERAKKRRERTTRHFKKQIYD